MILIVVCHPDDEALWFGGSLHALSKLVDCNVICLSGRDDTSAREAEFFAAQKVAGYSKGLVLGYPLRKAHQALPDIGVTVEEGLDSMGLKMGDVELLITHSPFGDEHLHPHHVQAFSELLAWTKKKYIPMGFFTTIPLPLGKTRSLLRNFPRHEGLHLTFLGRCSYGLRDFLTILLFNGKGWLPKYYVQWQTDINAKRAMLDCYKSIGLEEHAEGYAMYTSSVESFYLFDKRGFKVVYRIVERMGVPGAKDLFWRQLRLRTFASGLFRKLKNALSS